MLKVWGPGLVHWPGAPAWRTGLFIPLHVLLTLSSPPRPGPSCRLCQDAGFIEPEGRLPTISVDVVFHRYRPIGARRLVRVKKASNERERARTGGKQKGGRNTMKRCRDRLAHAEAALAGVVPLFPLRLSPSPPTLKLSTASQAQQSEPGAP
jgi:hypothetical protein